MAVLPPGHPERRQNLADWNKGNKLVDEQGNPLTLYRGAVGHKELPEGFLQGKTRSNYATFASTSPHLASTYANVDRSSDPDAVGGVMPIHAHAHVLHEFPTKGPSFDKFAFDKFARSLPKGHAVVARQVLDIGPRASNATDPEKRYSYPSDIYAWNEANSVKSAIGNRGTFDPNDPDITKAEGGSVIPPGHPEREENLRAFNPLLDKNGKPLVLYHGTDKDFSTFDSTKHGQSDHGYYGVGHYLTAEPEAASAYSAYRGSFSAMEGKSLHEGANVMPVHARLENPYIWPKGRRPAQTSEEAKAITEELISKGHDGVIVPNYYEAGPYASHNEVVVFSPTQIKSATGNQGTFDPENPDITKAEGGEVDNPAPEINNPVSVFPKPQRMFGEDEFVPGGKYLNAATKEDMTGHKSAAASIGVNPGGRPYFKASADAVDETGTPGRGSAITKTNLFKQRAGWNWLTAPEGHESTNTLVSITHRGDHFYALNAHFPKGVDLARYEKEKNEPRLRPTTRGNLSFGPQVGMISTRGGKEHPVYDHVIVKANGGAVGNEEEGIDVLHSSPYDFDRFDMSKIGTGEGNQVYGHGLYFSESPKVSGQGGAYWKQFFSRTPPGPEYAAAEAMFIHGFDRDKAIASLEKQRGYHELHSEFGYGLSPQARESADRFPEPHREMAEHHKRIVKDYNDAIDLLSSGNPVGPRTYEVRINAHPDHFIDWDAPISSQPEHIREVAKKFGVPDDGKGGLLWNAATRTWKGERPDPDSLEIHPSEPHASKLLLDHGIKGIKYFDARSRDEGAGTHNYVVFDDKLVNVKRKYADGGVVKENDHGEEKHQARAAGGNARSGGNPDPRKPRPSPRLSVSERSPIVDRALMIVSRKA